MPIYQWELSDVTGSMRIGQSSDENAEIMRRRFEEQGFTVHYILDIAQGKRIAGTFYVYSDAFADTTIAAELAQEQGFDSAT